MQENRGLKGYVRGELRGGEVRLQSWQEPLGKEQE